MYLVYKEIRKLCIIMSMILNIASYKVVPISDSGLFAIFQILRSPVSIKYWRKLLFTDLHVLNNFLCLK